MNRPPLSSRIRFDNGQEAEVIEHTERGFRYKGEPSSFMPRWGMSFTGEGEIFTDTPEYAWLQASNHPYFTIIGAPSATSDNPI